MNKTTVIVVLLVTLLIRGVIPEVRAGSLIPEPNTVWITGDGATALYAPVKGSICWGYFISGYGSNVVVKFWEAAASPILFTDAGCEISDTVTVAQRASWAAAKYGLAFSYFELGPSPTPTLTPTASETFTVTPTPTSSSTLTSTNTQTSTPTFTETFTQTSTPTISNTPTDTNSPTSTFTATNTDTPTYTQTHTNTPTSTLTATSTSSLTSTSTNTITSTSTETNTPSNTSTSTSTTTPTETSTFTVTSTPTPSITNTSTSTNTATRTLTYTSTSTHTSTGTPTQTPSNTSTLTRTSSATSTNTATSTKTPSSTNTETATSTSTFTPTLTSTRTSTRTATLTSSRTSSPTVTLTPSLNVTVVKGLSYNWSTGEGYYGNWTPKSGDLCWGNQIGGFFNSVVEFTSNLNSLVMESAYCQRPASNSAMDVRNYFYNKGININVLRVPNWSPTITRTKTKTPTSSRTRTPSFTRSPTKTLTPLPPIRVDRFFIGTNSYTPRKNDLCWGKSVDNKGYVLARITTDYNYPILITDGACQYKALDWVSVLKYIQRYDSPKYRMIYLP